MKHSTALQTLLITSLLVGLGLGTSATRAWAGSDATTERFVVVLRSEAVGLSPGQRGRFSSARLADAADGLANKARGRALGRFERVLPALVLETTADGARLVRADPRVAYVLPDSLISLAAVQPDPPSWGLDRIDQRANPLDGSFVYFSDSRDVHLYFVDTGLRATHEDFAGRVDEAESFSVIDDGQGTFDCYGHGTLVAGIAAGTRYGVAKDATLHPVRVFDCAGQGSLSGVLAGLDWVLVHHQAPAVVNLSLGGGPNQALDDAVGALTAAGITVVVAAGNSGSDACLYSPSRAPDALTVGAMNGTDLLASFSNQGTCVDLYAPGVMVTSTSNQSDTSAATVSGTSFAAGHVTGAAAQYLSLHPDASPTEVAWALDGSSVPMDSPAGTFRALYAAFGDPALDLPPFASFTVSCQGLRCDFDGTASFDDVEIVHWTWSPLEGGRVIESSRKSSIRFKYPRGTPWALALLTVTDTAGQTQTAAVGISFDLVP